MPWLAGAAAAAASKPRNAVLPATAAAANAAPLRTVRRVCALDSVTPCRLDDADEHRLAGGGTVPVGRPAPCLKKAANRCRRGTCAGTSPAARRVAGRSGGVGSALRD